MRFRGLLIAAIVLAVLGGAVYWSNKSKSDTSKASTDTTPKVVSIPEDQISKVEIKKTGGEDLVLQRNGAGKWDMTAPKALPLDQDSASSLVSTVASLSSDRVVEDKASNLADYGLSPAKMDVLITKKDGKTQQLMIGDETPTGSGYFAAVQGDPRVFTIASYSKTSLDKSPNDLRDKRLLTFDSDKLSRIELAAKGQDIEFGKNNQNDWQILKPQPLRADGGQVEDLIRKLKDARMDLSGAEADQKKAAAAFASGTPVATLKVTDASGTQQLQVKRDKDKNYYAKSSVVDGAYKVTNDLGDGLDKGLDDFRNKKLFDFGWSDPSKVDVRDGAKQVSIQKSGDKWMSNGKQMDSGSVQTLVDKLRDLAATKFVTTGFTTPIFEATVTSADGKKVEKVAIARNGDNYFAKRENEPSIYQLDASAFTDLQNAVNGLKPAAPGKK